MSFSKSNWKLASRLSTSFCKVARVADSVAIGEAEPEAVGVALPLAVLEGLGVPDELADFFLPISDLAASETVAPPCFKWATQET